MSLTYTNVPVQNLSTYSNEIVVQIWLWFWKIECTRIETVQITKHRFVRDILAGNKSILYRHILFSCTHNFGSHLKCTNSLSSSNFTNLDVEGLESELSFRWNNKSYWRVIFPKRGRKRTGNKSKIWIDCINQSISNRSKYDINEANRILNSHEICQPFIRFCLAF